MKIELKDSKIFIDEKECCKINIEEKEINVIGNPEYNFVIKLGFRGYKIYQDNILVGKGKGLILSYKSETLKPDKKSELLTLDLMYGNDIVILDKYNSSVGTLRLDNGKLIANFDFHYLTFGIIYLSYLFGAMNNTINAMPKNNFEKPLLSIRTSKSYMKISLLLFAILFIIVVFISYFSIILAYIVALFLLMVPLISRVFSANNFINFYNDHLEIINDLSNRKLIIYYSDINEIKNYKKGFLIYLSNPILEKKEIFIQYNPKINNMPLSEFLRKKINK
ncbi:hypothetical protein Calag_0291 [Caldisphaera lagunensis DSM 15908]|uniref:Uncharacterized protein n=1 Tax=Caldisphaera lagunensis (strain DSM 15908 / JCM 11604 / ANMR 0165 / IC-154) TaxID=1056495 RepID=L0A8A6_CALLD|nr:hypothetical protein [Caldisphaera lagunensis]AFZ70071.1 hypothetical protein Calag_0291 [Caldisphaera lagunensis DSM 15908]